MQASRPQGNGWYGASFDTSAQIYALCAAQRVLSGSVVTSGFNAHSSSNSYYPGDGSVNCPANQVATSGGFEGGDLILVSGRHETSSSGWFVEAGGDGDVTIYALCVVFRG